MVKPIFSMNKKVFCNQACNSIFELQRLFATHYISTSMNVIEQVARVAKDAIHCNLVATLLQQVIFNYYAIPL
jgi:hypothetical protein